jgi:hypothetical protein
MSIPSSRTPHRPPVGPLDETDGVTSAAETVMAGLVPAIHVVQPHRDLLLAPCRPSIWVASKLNHVEGLDKPGHDGK